MGAWITCGRLTSTSAEATPFCSNGHASNETPSPKDAYFTERLPLSVSQTDEAKSHLTYALNSPNHSDDGHFDARALLIPDQIQQP
jgi:hypothetical protein